MNGQIYLTGLSWKTGKTAGTINGRNVEAVSKNLFLKEFKNFGRLDPASKSLCAAMSLLLQEKKLYPSDRKLDIPVYLTSPHSPLPADCAYYADFLEFGSTAGRANLFIYTLPSSPLGEASVHFGLTGNMQFVNADNSIAAICGIISAAHQTDNSIRYYLAALTEEYADSADTLLFCFEPASSPEKHYIPIGEIEKIKSTSISKIKSEIILKHTEKGTVR